MNKVKVYKIGEAVESVNEDCQVVGEKEVAIIILNDNALLIDNDACHQIVKMSDVLQIGIAEKKKQKMVKY